MFHVPEKFRVKEGPMASTVLNGNNGVFQWKMKIGKDLFDTYFIAIASNGSGWEHVSMQIVFLGHNRLPTWDEMCALKALFWDAEDCVVQYHPPLSKYVDCHPFVLHLWRPRWVELPQPDPILVGPKMKKE
jgi:hypothetical protein